MRPTRLLTVASLLLACSPSPGDTTADSDATTSTTASTAPTSSSGSEPTPSDTTVSTTLEPTTTTSSNTDTSTTAPDNSTTSTTVPDTGTSTTGMVTGCADLPLCEDFEGAAVDGPPDPALWTVVSPNCSGTGTLKISDEQAHGGAHSLRVDGGGGYCDHVFIAHSATLASLGPQLHARFFIRLESALGQGHVTFLTARDSADNGKDLRMGGQSEILMWNRESDDATLPSLSPAGIALSHKPTAQQWTCIELMIDQSQGHLTTWVDSVEVQGLVVDAEATPDVDQQWLNKTWQPVLEDIKLGWESYAGQPMVLYFDDFALAPERIGCGD